MGSADLERRCIDTIRFLAADMVQQAKSGHPGLPLGAAAMAYVLWKRHLRHNPADPQWPNRDRFVLSAGHGSALLYALLHLTGYDLPLEELRAFRQWGSRTPGHPEAHHTPGVEMTTGPLGQGLSHAVGMAIAEAHLAARFNRPAFPLFDHYTYVLASDGDLMEGVSAEACALAGHLRLGKLIVLYDDNRVSLAGSTSLTFTEDVAARFRAYGWQVLEVPDGYDLEAVNAALRQAKADPTRPSLLMVRTVLGYGAPHKQGTFHAHGAPLGEEELRAAKEAAGWPTEPPFYIPAEVKERMREAVTRGAEDQTCWERLRSRYASAYPELAWELERRMRRELPHGWEEGLPSFEPTQGPMPTRRASEVVLQELGKRLPELMGGSADLNPSTLSWLKGEGDFQAPAHQPEDRQGAVGGPWGYEGRNLHFGVREHAMGAIAGGLALHGGILPYTATFLVFSDYMRPPVRLAALQGLQVIYLFTHDSIGVGEDGPTHQPVEQLMGLRTVPGLDVIRPADANETVEAWRAALRRTDGPTAIVLTRQPVPILDRRECAAASGLLRGGYVLWQASDGLPEVILIATGSEVALALAAGRQLVRQGIRARVVSLPCWELFERQPVEYRESVLPPSVRARVSIEAGVRLGWERYVGFEGESIGVDRFGASAPAEVLYERYGLTVEAIVRAAQKVRERLK
ncbi:MAG: transketolase [Chloroflexia bacterium]